MEPDGREWEMTAFDYSLNRGALKIYDILKAKGVKFSPRARVGALAIKMAAEYGKPAIFIKGAWSFQNTTERETTAAEDATLAARTISANKPRLLLLRMQ